MIVYILLTFGTNYVQHIDVMILFCCDLPFKTSKLVRFGDFLGSLKTPSP